MTKRTCEDCGGVMEEMDVEVEEATHRAKGWRCRICGNFEFDAASGREVVAELRDRRHLVAAEEEVQLEGGLDGLYLPLKGAIVERGHLEVGQRVRVRVPEEGHLVVVRVD